MHRPVRFRSWHNYCVCLNRGTAHDCGRAPQRIYYFESLKLFARYWLWYILIGLAAGYVASLIVKGSGSGMLLNLVIGMVGGVLGGWLFRLMGIASTNMLGSLLTSVFGAIVLLLIVGLFTRRKRE